MNTLIVVFKLPLQAKNGIIIGQAFVRRDSVYFIEMLSRKDALAKHIHFIRSNPMQRDNTHTPFLISVLLLIIVSVVVLNTNRILQVVCCIGMLLLIFDSLAEHFSYITNVKLNAIIRNILRKNNYKLRL